MLADKYISLSNDDLSTHIITPIIRREKYSINTIVPGLEMKFVEAVQKGIYLNDLAGPSGVPKLSLVLLHFYARQSPVVEIRNLLRNIYGMLDLSIYIYVKK
ncbi:hypothetical protein O9G_005309 [Rozella allomycis CSF55]|uniref:Uncharacterized protein n=1 Tax=Rozella allomycis (strain CSF55) TaxID=988480 RepID=A0A075APH2_ROZAC|nr:hypothetical protein O9G_005309 [Rozella allomycis CSF55]|eukprot:EPZ32004.1 hypothetical protein O9G_005309 [Rozella allomycis CSF55]